MKSDEAVLRVQNFFERLVDAEQQLIQVRGLIQSVDDIGDDLALFLHALQVGDIEKADYDGLDAGVAQMVLGGNFKPTPQAVFALEAAAGVEPGARRFTQLLKASARRRLLVRVQQVDDGLSDQFAGEITENASKSFICIENRAVAVEKSKEFARRSQQRRKLLGAQHELLGREAL